MNRFPMWIAAAAGAALAFAAPPPPARAADAVPEFDPADSTRTLQSAIDSGAARVVVRKMPGPWIAGPLRLASNQEIFFEPGAEVLAKKDAFHGTGDSLFTGSGCVNVRLVGPGATLRMRRGDYDGPAYKHAEWRHVLNLHSVTNVLVEGLTLAESGGDGVYLGVDRGGGPCVGVTIRKVLCDRNYRQGVSVISAERMLMEDVVLRETGGTAPEAGIDFEPNRPGERLADCVLRRVIAENNRGSAYTFYTANLCATSMPLGVRFEDCVSRGTNRISLAVHLASRTGAAGPAGLIEFVRCRFADDGRAGVRIGKTAAGAKVRFEGCALADPSASPSPSAPLTIETNPGHRTAAGGVDFGEFRLVEKIERPPLAFRNGGGVPLSDVTGALLVERGGEVARIALDDAWRAKIAPPDPFFDLAPVTFDPGAIRPSQAAAPEGGWTYPALRFRGRAVFVVHAAAASEVRLRLRHQTVGRSSPDAGIAVKVEAPSGRVVAKAKIPGKGEGDCVFRTSETGFHRVVCEAESHSIALLSSSHAAAAVADDGLFHLVSTSGELCFAAPVGGRWGVRVGGAPTGETVRAILRDPGGAKAWAAEALESGVGWIAPKDAAGGVWRLQLGRASRGVLEDEWIELRGLPPVLSPRPETVPEVRPR